MFIIICNINKLMDKLTIMISRFISIIGNAKRFVQVILFWLRNRHKGNITSFSEQSKSNTKCFYYYSYLSQAKNNIPYIRRDLNIVFTKVTVKPIQWNRKILDAQNNGSNSYKRNIFTRKNSLRKSLSHIRSNTNVIIHMESLSCKGP